MATPEENIETSAPPAPEPEVEPPPAAVDEISKEVKVITLIVFSILFLNLGYSIT